MVTNARSRVWLVMLVLTAIMLVHPPSARADRIDIDDPSVLGSVLHSVDLGDRGSLQGLITEVRYAAGIYSYIYAIQTSPYLPSTFCCEPTLLRFTVTGHSLEETWGAVNSSNGMWDDEGNPVSGPTNTVVSMTPVHNGFLVVPEGNGAGSFTVVYMQSPLLPSQNGILTYTGRVIDHDHGGVVITESEQWNGAFVPTPEPGTIGLFGLGLATLAAKLRASHHRRVARPR